MLRATLNAARRHIVRWLQFRILFGERSQGIDLPHTRISPSTCIEHEDRLMLADHVYIGPFNLLDASGGITIEEGVQITSHVCIVTHSSHRAMRLLGHAYVEAVGELPGWVAGPVVIGAWSFIGPQSVIEANTRLGRGTIVRAGSVVRGSFPEFAVLEGRPARVVGDARDGDAVWLARDPSLRARYEATWGPQSDPPASGGKRRSESTD